MQNVYRNLVGNLKGTLLRDREIDGMVTIKWILKEYEERVQTVIIQLSSELL
jgi:hypothetical protein